MEDQKRLTQALADRYRIERQIGSGGMATVYLAEDLKHHRKVAIKVLTPEVAHAVGPERFLNEIEIAANLTHPNILPLHDSGQADGLLYYVMPYVEGESLRDRLIREKHLPLEDAIRIVGEVADALSYAHDLQLIHRDIKPENILSTAGHAVVADFGIARAVDTAGGDRLTKTGLTVGTPTYMSPEQAAGTEALDGRSDTYSLACLAYEMLGGEPPFTGPTPQAVLARHAVDPVPELRTIRPGIPAGVEQAIEKALAKVPADRFPTAQAFADALTNASTDEAIAAEFARRGREAGRRRMGLAAVVVLLAALGVWVVTGLGGPRHFGEGPHVNDEVPGR
jgi:serine/threonine-protein kinase